MDVQTQKAAFSSIAASQLITHGRRGKRRSKHFTQFLTCRTTQQKVQGSTHNAKSAYSSRLRKHPQLHLAAELARHPAAPGLLFTAAGLQGFTVVSKVAGSVIDKGSLGAETLGTAITNQLQQASNRIAVQTEASQNSFQEWKGLMNGIISEEANRVQAELDRASKTAAMWQQKSSETIAQVRDDLSKKPELKSHPLGLPQVKVSELQSGWLVDALQERFPQAGSPSAWPTSFFVTAGSDSSSDSMSFSDDEDRKAASSPTFVSRFKNQAKDLTTQLPNVARSRAAALDRNMTAFGSVASDLMTSVISQAEQLPDVARSRSAAFDRSLSGVRSAASDFVTSVVSKAAELPGQQFGVSSFSSSSSPQHASSKIGQTGGSYGRQLSRPASFTARLPSPEKASSNPAASAASTAASATAALLPSSDRTAIVPPTVSASSKAAAVPSASPTQPASPSMASPARKVAPQKGSASPSKLSLRKPKTKPSAGLPLVKTANSQQSIPRPPASSSGEPIPAKLPGEALTHGSTSSAAKREESRSYAHPSPPPQPSANASSPVTDPIKDRAMSAASSRPEEPSAAPAASSASAVESTTAVPDPDQSGIPAGSSSPAEAQGSSRRAAGNAGPSAETAGAAAQLPFTAVAGVQGPSTASAQSALPAVSAKEGIYQAKGGVPQANMDAPQTKGNALQAKGGGAQQMASVAGDDTQSGAHSAEQHQVLSSTAHAGDSTMAAPQGQDQLEEQPKAKTPIKRVRVVRPMPTPNWRAPRPLTPPPTPVQQGHPLSAPPAQGAYPQTASGQQRAPVDDSTGQSQDRAASTGVPSDHEDSSASDVVATIRPSSVSRNASATQTLGLGVTKPDSPQPLAGSSNSVAEMAEQSSSPRQQPNTTAAAAAAVESEATTVIDDISWGTRGTATARGSHVSPQTGGGIGGGSSTGGTIGGGGGGRHRSSGDSGDNDGGHRSSSTWRQWWLGLLLLGGVATAVSMSSAARAAFMNAVAAIKAKLAPAKREEQQQEEGEVLKEEENEKQPRYVVPTEFNARVKDSIATNIKVNEGDTAWSIAEEYSGGGTAWPEVVSSNPQADTAKPTSGMTLRVSVRM